MPARVLLVEDEPEMQMILHDNLEYEGYRVLSAENGEAGVEIALRERPDVILLDLMLPRMTGYEVCRRIRAAGFDVPIIMLTARNQELDRIAGLELGANDYVGKPFSVREIIARIRAQLRTRERRVTERGRFTFGDVTVDFTSRTARRGSKDLGLSTREFELLRYLIDHKHEVIPRERLLADVWQYDRTSLSRTTDNFVARLRKKVERDHRNPRHITTVYGIGYRFVA